MEIAEKQKRLLTEPVEKLVLSLSLPSVAIMLITAAYNLADTWFVSGLGTSATAAVGVVFSLMSVIQAIGFFFGNGSGNFVSRELGAGVNETAATMASTGCFLSLIFGGVITVTGLLFLEPLLLLLGASETMLPYARDYMVWILLAAPFMTASLTLNNQLRFLASANSAMWGMIAGALLNIIGDPILIYGFGLGTFGAGLSTAISQFVGFLVLLRMTRRPGNIPMKFRNFKPNGYYVKEITRGGLPSLLRQSFNSFAIIIFNHAGGLFGDQAVAAISIVQRVSAFAISALLGFGQGFQPVCGFNYGAKRYDRVVRAFIFCTKIITIALAVFALFGFIFAPQVIASFRADDAEVIAIGAVILRLQCCTLPFMGFVILCNMMLQTIGAAGKASLLAISRSGLFLAPSIVILVAMFKLPGLEWAQTVADILTFGLAAPLSIGTLSKMSKMSKMMKEPED